MARTNGRRVHLRQQDVPRATTAAAVKQNSRNLAIRASRWLTRNWRESRKGNEFLNLKGYNLGVFPDSRHPGKWNWWIIKGNYKRYGDGPYPSSDHAKMRLFDYLTKPASTPSA